MNIKLDNRRALVTGASSGIGEAIALSLAEAGATVGINYRKHSGAADKNAQAIRQRGGRADVFQADVADPAAVAEMFRKMDSTFGGIDILVNNAGIDGDRALSWESGLGAWRSVLEINLFGTFHCAREALKRMVPQKAGVILNISSVHEVIPWAGYSAYTASKAAVSMLTKTLAQEAAPYGIRVLAIAPGAIKTPINRSVWDDPNNVQDLLKKIPLNRVGESDEIARMAVVLVSDAASYVTGTTVFVDGGMVDYPDFAHGG